MPVTQGPWSPLPQRSAQPSDIAGPRLPTRHLHPGSKNRPAGRKTLRPGRIGGHGKRRSIPASPPITRHLPELLDLVPGLAFGALSSSATRSASDRILPRAGPQSRSSPGARISRLDRPAPSCPLGSPRCPGDVGVHRLGRPRRSPAASPLGVLSEDQRLPRPPGARSGPREPTQPRSTERSRRPTRWPGMRRRPSRERRDTTSRSLTEDLYLRPYYTLFNGRLEQRSAGAAL